MQRTFLNLLGALFLAIVIAPPVQGACPLPARVVAVEPGRAVVFIDKTDLMSGLTSEIVGFLQPHHGVLEDLGDRFAYSPGDGFWTAGVDSFNLLLTSDRRQRSRAERVLLVPATLSAAATTEGFDGASLSWALGGSTTGLEIFNGAGVLSGSRSLRLRGGSGEPAWLAESLSNNPAVVGENGGGQQGSTAQSTIRPPGGGGGSGLGAITPTELAVLEGSGASVTAGYRVWLRDDGEALSLRLEDAFTSSPWLPLSRGEHRLQVTQWTASLDLERRSGLGLWVDGALVARLQPPAGNDVFERAATLRVGVLAQQGQNNTLTAEMDDLRFAGLALYPEAACRVADGFESGEPDPVWTVNGNVAIAADAALGTAPFPNGGTLDATLPGNDPRLGLRFRFDPNSVGLTAGSRILLAEGITSGGERALALLLEPASSGYRLLLLTDDDRMIPPQVSSPVVIADAPQAVTLDWRRGISQFANTGTLRLWIGGQLKAEITGIRNAAQDIQNLRVGAEVVGGALGRVFFDQVEAVRGPLP
jgi:hypothetical protein